MSKGSLILDGRYASARRTPLDKGSERAVSRRFVPKPPQERNKTEALFSLRNSSI